MTEMIGEIDMDKVWNEFERMTKEAEKVQKETLKRILEENASAEYLQSLGLNGKTDPESYKALVPVVEHKYFKSLRLKKLYRCSSGTTGGKQKLIPWNDELWETTIELYQTSLEHRNSLEGKITIVMGGARGIGEAIVILFVKHGTNVVIADVEDEIGKILANSLSPSAIYVYCDVSNEKDIENLVTTTISHYGQLDIMFNNAGILENHKNIRISH